MASKRLRIDAAASLNVYFVVWRASDNYVFDFNDNSFKSTVGGATTPYLAATENTATGGTGRSHYVADLNLALIAAGLKAVDVIIQPYQRSGGSPAPLTDATLNDPASLRIRLGMSDPVLDGKLTPALRREYNRFEASFTLTADGSPVDFGGTATLRIRGVASVVGDASAAWFADITGTLTSEGRIEFSLSTPGFEGDRAYTGLVTLSQGGESVTFEGTFRIMA